MRSPSKCSLRWQETDEPAEKFSEFGAFLREKMIYGRLYKLKPTGFVWALD